MKTRRPNSDRIAIGAILFVFIASLVLFILFLREYHAVNLAAQWPSTEAIVVNCQVTSSTNIISGNLGNSIVKNDEIDFAFAYQVNNQKYISRKFYPDGELIEQPIVTGFSVGRHFSAHYNPHAPEIAVVESGSVHYRFLIAAIICLGLTIVGTIYNFRVS